MPGGGVSSVGIRFGAIDNASGIIGGISRGFTGLMSNVQRGVPILVGGFASIAAGAQTMQAGLAGIRTAWQTAVDAGEFEREMAAVRTISQATAEEFQDLGAAAVEAGIQTQFAPVEAAGGLRVLTQQGLIAQDAISGLVPVLDFAAAGNIEVAEAAEVAMGVMNAYGMTVEDMTSVTDRLMRGTQLSALGADQFSLIMGRAASSGRIFGTNLDDIVIALGSLRSAGIPATVATTALDNAMRRLTTDPRALRNLQRYGVEYEDQEGNLRSVIDITRDFAGAIGDMTQAQQASLVSQTFGVRGLRAFNAIANIQARVVRDGAVVTLRGAEAVAHYRRELDNASGTTEEFRTRTLATFRGQMILLEGTMQTFTTVFGRTFGVIFRPLVLAVTESINLLARAWRDLPDLMQQVIGIGFLLTSGFLVIAGALGIVAGVAAIVIVLFGEVLLAALAVAAAIGAAFIPIIAITATLVGIGAALFFAWRDNLGGLADFVDSWVQRIQLLMTGLRQIWEGGLSGDFLVDLIESGEGPLAEFLMFVQSFVDRARALWGGFRDTIGVVWQALAPVFAQLTHAIEDAFGVVGELFGSSGLAGIADVPISSYAELGAVIAERVGVVIARVIQFVTRLIRIFIGFVRVIQWIRGVLEPWGRMWVAVWGPIIQGAVALLQALMAIQRILRWVSPTTWIIEGLEALGGEEGQALTPAETSDLVRGGRRRQRQEEDRRRSEASTSRPAAAAREGQADIMGELADLLGEGGGRRGGTTRLENRVTLELDRRTLSEVVQGLELDDDTGGGRVVTDELGQRQSVF
jgi:TP901 family phage tail tape measure protein